MGDMEQMKKLTGATPLEGLLPVAVHSDTVLEGSSSAGIDGLCNTLLVHKDFCKCATRYTDTRMDAIY